MSLSEIIIRYYNNDEVESPDILLHAERLYFDEKIGFWAESPIYIVVRGGGVQFMFMNPNSIGLWVEKNHDNFNEAMCDYLARTDGSI